MCGHIRDMIGPELKLCFICHKIVCKPSSHTCFCIIMKYRCHLLITPFIFIYLIAEDPIVTVKCRTAIKGHYLYFDKYLCKFG